MSSTDPAAPSERKGGEAELSRLNVMKSAHDREEGPLPEYAGERVSEPGYTGVDCPWCGRNRVMRVSTRLEWCEKCERVWSPETIGLAPAQGERLEALVAAARKVCGYWPDDSAHDEQCRYWEQEDEYVSDEACDCGWADLRGALRPFAAPGKEGGEL